MKKIVLAASGAVLSVAAVVVAAPMASASISVFLKSIDLYR